jgi:competence protein ComEC
MNLNDIVSATKALLPQLRVAPTRFRAYRLGSAGASFSYFDGETFTLIEARVNDTNRKSIRDELAICGKRNINVLHITSWDRDHCNLSELREILEVWRPTRVEYPGYEPITNCGIACRDLIREHVRRATIRIRAVAYTPSYIKTLESGVGYGYKDLVYHPKTLYDKSNDNSTVKLYRTGCFNVLSLGDVESPAIAALIKSCQIARGEIDVLIMPHHGADNGFLTSDLLDEIRPRLAVCGVDHSNQYGHPAPTLRQLLGRKEIPFATTIRGDVLVCSENGTSHVRWIDTMGATTEVHKHGVFEPKKFDRLKHNADSIRARRIGAPYRRF